jgi:integrase/recombinase XerD
MAAGSAVINYEGKRGVVWRIKYRDATGRQVMETLGREADGWTERKARAELRERLVRVERQAYRRPAPLTFAAYAERWLAEGERRRGWTRNTLRTYRFALARLLPSLGPLRLAAVRPRHLSAYMAEQLARYSATTVSFDIGLVHDLYESARREEVADANPAEHVERPRRQPPRWRVLEPAEVARVARAFSDERARTVFLTLVLTGLRKHELRNLRWRDISFVEEALRVRKSKSRAGERAIALPAPLMEALWQLRRSSPYQGDDEYVFAEPSSGRALSVEGWRASLAAALEEAGVEGYVRPFHDLRHTAITNDAAAGASPAALMAKAGHGSMSTTQTYLHLAGVLFREEADALARRLLGSEVSTEPPEVSTGLSTRLTQPQSP